MIHKKSQMEILGLAIVVLLVTLAMVFVIRFLALSEPEDIRSGVVESQVASNYITTYLKTSVEGCNGLSITDLLQDCAIGGNICNGQDSCQKAEEVAETIFLSTFDAWNTQYGFEVYLDEDNPKIELGPGCTGERRSKLFPLPTGVSPLFVKLDLC